MKDRPKNAPAKPTPKQIAEAGKYLKSGHVIVGFDRAKVQEALRRSKPESRPPKNA